MLRGFQGNLRCREMPMPGVLMCDTFAIGSACTRGGESIFGKNSDREPDEAQIVVSIPGRKHTRGETMMCTYSSIPQVASTRALVLSKPFWLWGAEMGVNEKGVVIGNEALFTRIKPEKAPGLIGMDLLRLGLERADTAHEAAHVIIDLLRRYGQAGPCGYTDKGFQYMNSYLIMDRSDIIVLETMGRDYVLTHPKDYAAISNGITTKTAGVSSSFAPDVRVDALADPLITRFAGSAARRQQNLEQLERRRGSFTVTDAFAMLRSHRGRHPLTGFNQDVCMHAAGPLIRKSQTTGSMVVALDADDGFKIFVTAGSCPCLTPFKPFLPACPPGGVAAAGPRYAEDSYWWRHEAFHIDAVLRYRGLCSAMAGEVSEMEERYCQGLPFYRFDTRDASLAELSSEAFTRASMNETAWTENMRGIKKDLRVLHNAFWVRMARRRGVPLAGKRVGVRDSVPG